MSKDETASGLRFVPDASSSVVHDRVAGSSSPATASPQSHMRLLGLGRVMRAIRFEVFGDPTVLDLAEVPAPAADEKTAVVRVMAASINPSDVKNVAGASKQTRLPRIPGRDFAGVVEAGPAEWIGAEVWARAGTPASPVTARMPS